MEGLPLNLQVKRGLANWLNAFLVVILDAVHRPADGIRLHKSGIIRPQ
jgi:hypothetical protein